MKRKLAERLVNGLEEHPNIIRPDREKFIDILEKTNVPESERFYEHISGAEQPLPQYNRCYSLSLTRILRNRQAEEEYQIPILKEIYDIFISTLRRIGDGKIRIYDSNALSRKIRTDIDLVKMMTKSNHPYSLLGKFETRDRDFKNPDKSLIETRPVLVIPGAKNIEYILDWEKAHTIHEEESRFLFFEKRKIIEAQEHRERSEAHEYYSFF